MNAERIAAQGNAALICFLLLIFTPVLWADVAVDADLLGIERLDTGSYENRISVRIGTRVERLLVSPNPYLNDLRIVSSDGAILKQNSTAYAGIIESLPNSWARVVIDGDYITGTIQSRGSNTHFTSEPVTGLPSNKRLLLEPLTPPPENPARRTALSAVDVEDQISVPVSERLTDSVGDVTRVISVGIVVDSLYQEALGGRGLSNAISTINSVDALYRENFGLALKIDVIVLVTDETFLTIDRPPEGEPVFTQTTLKDHLDLFREYRINAELLPDDLGLVHLFSGVQTEDQAIGLAFKGAACRTDGHDVSMSRPFLFPVLLSAHEIGHNLGADHDDTTDCRLLQDNVMFSAISATTTREFSSCSTDAINTRIDQSTCFTAEIDIGLNVVQLESNQIQIIVSNLDETRAFPSATLSIDLNNTSFTEAPALCELEDPSKLTCVIPATFAGDTQELAVKLRLEQDLVRTVTMRLEPNGFFDLNEGNNTAEVVIRGEPLPLAVTEGEITTQGNSGSGGSTESDGGGGTAGLPLLMLLLINAAIRRSRTVTARTSL